MSERTEKQVPRSERPVVTPQPTRRDLFEWVEEHFQGREHFPRYFELHQAVGRTGREWRPETIYQKEFKPHEKKPERAEMVEISNKLYALAQSHCNEAGRVSSYVILAINHVKGAHPYGIHLLCLRPLMSAGGFPLNAGDGDDVLPDGTHRQDLLTQSLDHQRSNDEHTRFIYDLLQKSTGNVMEVLLTDNKALRERVKELEGMQITWWKSIQESEDRSEERKMKNAQNKVKMEIMERGAGLLMQMIPVVAKSLEKPTNGTAALPAAGTPVSPSAESIAIEQFVRSLTEDQKAKLFGTFDPTGVHHPTGIFTADQVKVFAEVGECRAPASVLELLHPGQLYGITTEQIAKVQACVEPDKLMPLYALLVEGQKKQQEQSNASA